MKTQSVIKKGSIFLMGMMLVFIMGACNKDDGPELSNYIPLPPPLAGNVTLEFKDLRGEETAPWFATQVTVKWAAVQGASAYFFTLYDVTGGGKTLVGAADNVEVTENPPSISRPLVSERKYLVVLRSKGSDAFESDDSVETTEIPFNTETPTMITIPPGNLTAYFTANPVYQVALATVQAYELAAGGAYTMNGDIFIGGKSVSIKGANPANRAKIAITNGSFVIGGGSFVMEDIDIDCSGTTGTIDPQVNPVFRMHNDFPKGAKLNAAGFCLVPEEGFVLRNVNLSNVKGSLFSDGGSEARKFALPLLKIDNCIINFEMPLVAEGTLQGLVPHFRFAVGVLKEFNLNNSTFYTATNVTPKIIQADSRYQGRRFLATPNGTANADAVPEWVDENGISGLFKVTKCTFFQMCMAEHIFNGMSLRAGPATIHEIANNVFYESFAGLVHRYLGGLTGASIVQDNYLFTLNAFCYRWPNDVIPNNGGGVREEWSRGGGKDGGTIFGVDVQAIENKDDIDLDKADPELKLTSGAGVFPPVFNMNAEAKAAGIGDPRWLN